jgi:hypothetical protein
LVRKSSDDNFRSGKPGFSMVDPIRQIRDLGLDLLEVEILSRLLQGPRTRNELVEEIYEVRRGEDGYNSCYAKVRRAIKVLLSRGYVATKILGKEKPYRITRYAVETLGSIAPGQKPPSLVGIPDMVAYSLCVLLGIVTTMVISWADMEPSFFVSVIPASFFLFLGVSLTRIWETVRKVMW